MSDLFRQILDTFDSLGLWEDGVALIGSWSFLLYQRHLGVKPLPLRTQDIDFLLPRPYPKRAAVDLEAALTRLGFHKDFTSSGAIYFTHPELRIEFLTPERGKGDDGARMVRPLGIRAISLRFLDMLFEGPIRVREGNATVTVPNPLNFCLHKLIVAQRRKNQDKKEKDLEQAVYVLPILEPTSFEEAFGRLPRRWRAFVDRSLGQATDLFPLERPVIDGFAAITPHNV